MGDAVVDQGLNVIRGTISDHWAEAWAPVAANFLPEGMKGGRSLRL